MNVVPPAISLHPSSPRKAWETPTIEESSIEAVTASKGPQLNEDICSKNAS